MLSKELLQLPKIDLHCHLDGSMTMESIREILREEISPEALKVSEGCQSLGEYLEKFEIPLRCLQTREGLKKSARDFLRSLEKDQIQYVEVRFAPQLSTGNRLSCGQIMEAVLEGLEEAKQLCGIYYQVIACTMRHHSEEINLQMLKECREFLGNGLAAVDLAGDEGGFPTNRFRKVFEFARRLDYPFTIHAGECGSIQSMIDAVDMGAKRIGHGIAMMGNAQVQKKLAEKHIGVEMCPVSNYQTKALQPGMQYPIREFFESGLLVTVNTDNRTVSDTSISKEMEFLQENFGITDEELLAYQRNAVETAFCDDALKHKLIQKY